MRPAFLTLSLGILAAAALAQAYPIDEYERTGIRRLEIQKQAVQGLRRGTKLVPGAKWRGKDIQLRMRERGRDYELTRATAKDAALQAALEKPRGPASTSARALVARRRFRSCSGCCVSSRGGWSTSGRVSSSRSCCT